MRKLTDDEIAATPLAPGFVYKCHSRRPGKPNEILLHLECPRGHQILKARSTADGGCDKCRREKAKEGVLPPNWQEMLASLPDYVGLNRTAIALGISHETVIRYRARMLDFKAATERLNGKPHRGSEPGERGPDRSTLEQKIESVQHELDDLREEHDTLEHQVKTLREENKVLRQRTPQAALEIIVAKLRSENKELTRRLALAENDVPESSSYWDLGRTHGPRF